MEELLKRSSFSLGAFCLVLRLLGVSAQAGASVPSQHTSAYFNSSIASLATVSSILNLKGHTTFSFRTCSKGVLISQTGASGSSFQISLTALGSLQVHWRYLVTETGEYVEKVLSRGEDSLRNNQWYTVELKYFQGKLHLTIEQGKQMRFRELLANSTYQRYLWDLDLSGGEGVKVGEGYTGCFLQGLGVNLSASDTIATNVLWDTCPLESKRGCDPLRSNPCWSYPCQNDGVCIMNGTTYHCNCPIPYSGRQCQTDLGYKGCELGPCSNGGTCETRTNGTRRYICNCPSGFTGVHCEININECETQPCMNGGSCTDQVNGFSCDCDTTGFEGALCETNINECVTLEPCGDRGLCSDTPGSFKCRCPPGYAGATCEQAVNECNWGPCLNDGICTDYVGDYNCTCTAGFTGKNCEVDINECVSDPCTDPSRYCEDDINGYVCLCKPGNQEENGVCVDVDECSSVPCLNGATCYNMENNFLCQCSVGYTGMFCEVDIDECTSQPCFNGATCRDEVGQFRCDCAPGYGGVNCSVDINECASNPCQNNAPCQDKVASYTCICQPGFTGAHCETNIDECVSLPCVNGATCRDEVNSYRCDCPQGYTGIHCETDINECEVNPCKNNATCEDRVADYNCICTEAWMGKNCSQPYDACSFGPCKNEGNCTSIIGRQSYNCKCRLGFTGVTCETNIDDCVGHTCLDYQVCVDQVNTYTCACPSGYEGNVCDQEINECLSSPCVNGGTCLDQVANYSCTCAGQIVDLTDYTPDQRKYWAGFAGRNCEIAVNECEYDPPICLNNGICRNTNDSAGFSCYCHNGGGSFFTGPYCEKVKEYCQIVEDPPACYNGGTCQSGLDHYSCTCAPGFTGIRCETNIDECVSMPCQNGGTCDDQINGYQCLCQEGITGSDCETNINECFSNPCQNEGQCIDSINRYACDCNDTGFHGIHCEINIDDCQPDPCQNGGQCLDAVKNYTCKCFEGYVGHSCEIDVNECLSTPCQNNASCRERSIDISREGFSFDTASGFDCHCAPGYNGTLCELDIDECVSNPCQHGTCEDKVNGYFCHCEPGYRGNNCQEEINECLEWRPCKNGASCVDLVNDYSCVCAPNINGSEFSGRNCTVKLIGCEGNQCQNEATCMPYLVDEVANDHNYTCSCRSGYTGFYCGVATTASFDGRGWMLYEGGENLRDLSMSLRFRTTLPNATLTFMHDETKEHIVYLVLTESRTLILTIKLGSMLVKTVTLATPSQQSLNDASWYKVAVTIGRNVILRLDHPDCGPSECVETDELQNTGNITLTALFFGGKRAGLADSAVSAVSRPLIGCLQDVTIKESIVLVPEEFLRDGSQNFSLGCPRTEQCDPWTCQNDGVCLDLWNDFQCQCERPFVGVTCNTSLTPGTFGFRDEVSYASVYMGSSERQKLQNKNVISMFFRTRKENGLLVMIGHRVPPTVSFIMAGLEGGYVKVWIKLVWERPADEVVINSQRFDDGEQHFLFINRTEGSLHVQVDDHPVVSRMYESMPLIVSELFVGGLPPGKTRRKRQADNIISDMPKLDSFKGILQDVRLNGELLQFFPVNETGIPASLSQPYLDNVRIGVVDDELCDTGRLLCENNGTCNNRFFNDFSCDCPDGFKGKNCSALNFCLYAKCPENSTCNDLVDGHECVASATFNGFTSYLQYNTNVNLGLTKLNIIKLTIRTRQPNALLFHAKGRDSLSQNFLTIQLKDQKVIVYFNLGEESGIVSKVAVSDGSWHNLTVGVRAEDVSLQVDDGALDKRFTTQTVLLSHLFNHTNNIYVGGVPYPDEITGMVSDPYSNYKGCLDEMRVDGVLLPFYTFSEGYNSTSFEQFVVLKKDDVQTGCHGDDVCRNHQCVNGATCVDIWNDYSCECVLGFNGTLCENNIDECVNHRCENEAVCVDAINNYTCDCQPGFAGFWCQENIDECLSFPCENNGTCLDGINGYHCNCSGDYIGNNCEIAITEKCDNETNYPCVNGTCLTVNTSYPGVVTFECKCLEGYTGRLCETPIDYCAEDPCVNGTCKSRTDLLNYVCQCTPGFEGRNCSDEINECRDIPCKNNGTCTDKLNSFICNCTQGWEGDTCELDVNECNLTWHNNSPPCERGTCINTDGGYKCNCTGTGYEGDRCQIEIDECVQSDICNNNGECINLNGTFECNCSLGYEGDWCQTPNCTADICLYDANCTITDNKWQCKCEEYFEGERCSHRGPCADFPCVNNGTCQQELRSDDTGEFNYTCLCPPGWEGQNCTEDVQECETNPCKNDATCSEEPPGSFTCTCPPGFTGRLCDEDIDECESNPCRNGGTCTDDINGYVCKCDGTGFTGPTCEDDINECEVEDICKQGKCNNYPGMFNCTCYPGYVGRNCHSEDLCYNATFCENDGNCTLHVNDTEEYVTAECHCVGDFIGPRCEVKADRVGPDSSVPWNIIGGVFAGAIVLIIIIAVIAFLIMARKKRATRGTYSPSWQEMAGSRVEMGNVLKPPPEERLI